MGSRGLAGGPPPATAAAQWCLNFLAATTTVRSFRLFGGEKTDKNITGFYARPSCVPCTHIIVGNIDKKKKKRPSRIVVI